MRVQSPQCYPNGRGAFGLVSLLVCKALEEGQSIMGIFYEQTEVVNRTSGVLHVRFDGQDIELPPNYDADGNRLPDVHNFIPTVTVPYAKSQNVLMGSEAPLDPSDYEVLVAKVADKKKGEKQTDDTSFCEQSRELTRVKLDEYLDDPSVKIQVGGRRVKASEALPHKPIVPFDIRPA